MTDYVKELGKLARAYSAAEETIVRAFFAKPHKKSDHLRWLRAQAFKEYSAIKPIFTSLAKLYPEVDRQIDRHEFEALTEKLADETKHARLVMDLLEELTGKKVTFADLLWLPEDRKLAKIRARYSKSLATLLHGNGTIKAKEIRRQDAGLERAAITLTEGGGGALYLVCSRLKTHGFEGKMSVYSRKSCWMKWPTRIREFELSARSYETTRLLDAPRALSARCPASACECATNSSAFH